MPPGASTPSVTVEDYEHILTVLENMVGVMEQSPGAFREIDEESLRSHFLVQLNGQKISSSTSNHANFKKLAKQRSESSWTYLFGHKDDPSREIFITVQAHNVPERIEPRIRPLGR